jgi:hypothetical protein
MRASIGIGESGQGGAVVSAFPSLSGPTMYRKPARLLPLWINFPLNFSSLYTRMGIADLTAIT